MLSIVLSPNLWSILENLPGAYEKAINSVAVEWNILWMSVKSIWSKLLFKFNASLLIFCLDNLCSAEHGALKSSWSIALNSISPFRSNIIHFVCLGVSVVGSYIFRMIKVPCRFTALLLCNKPIFLFLLFVT